MTGSVNAAGAGQTYHIGQTGDIEQAGGGVQQSKPSRWFPGGSFADTFARGVSAVKCAVAGGVVGAVTVAHHVLSKSAELLATTEFDPTDPGNSNWTLAPTPTPTPAPTRYQPELTAHESTILFSVIGAAAGVGLCAAAYLGIRKAMRDDRPQHFQQGVQQDIQLAGNASAASV